MQLLLLAGTDTPILHEPYFSQAADSAVKQDTTQGETADAKRVKSETANTSGGHFGGVKEEEGDTPASQGVAVKTEETVDVNTGRDSVGQHRDGSSSDDDDGGGGGGGGEGD